MNLLNFAFFFFALVQVVSAKRFDINHTLRIQMARIRHQYDVEKNTMIQQLKDQDIRLSIKKNLMNNFLKAKNATMEKVRLEKLRSESLLMAQKRINRSDTEQVIGLSRLKRLQKFHA